MSRDRPTLREHAGRAICVPLRGSCPGPGCSGFWRLAEPSLALVRDGVACVCVNVQQWDIPAASFHFHSAYHVTAIPSPRNTYATHSPWATHDDRHHRRDPWFSDPFSFDKHRARQEPRLLPSPAPSPSPSPHTMADSNAPKPSSSVKLVLLGEAAVGKVGLLSISMPCRTQAASRLTSRVRSRLLCFALSTTTSRRTRSPQ